MATKTDDPTVENTDQTDEAADETPAEAQPDTETTDQPEAPESAAQDGEDGEGGDAEPEPEPEPVQPAEADTDTSAAVELHTPRGALTLRPGQVSLDANQSAALVAIGIDTVNDPAVIPHVRPFMHMCQTRDLDPWAKEAYLIGRGKDQHRKYTMQVGIDGYRKMAGATGRFIRVKDTLWTGSDDDDRSYRLDAHGVMRRVWWDQWPASRGYPGAAKAVIEHYDAFGNVVTTEGIADWGMYAPFSPKWEGWGRDRKKVRGPDGGDVMVLNEMWAKGFAHMLSKCSEALAHRKAFPATMSGIYTHEEMHRADQIERDRQDAEVRAKRQQAFAAAQQRQAAIAPPAQDTVPGSVQKDDGEPESGPLFGVQQPVHVSEVVDETVAQMSAQDQAAGSDASAQPSAQAGTEPAQPVSDEQQGEWLRAEIAMLADVYGHPVQKMYARQVRALHKNPEEFTVEDLLRTLTPLRKGAPTALRRAGRDDDADAYQSLPDGFVGPLHVLLGHPAPADAEADVAGPVDPTRPHAYVDQEGVCSECERFADDIIHPESATEGS